MWDDLELEDRLKFLSNLVAVDVTEIDANTVYLAETYLPENLRKKYADYCTAEVSRSTYAVHSPSHPDTVYYFYFNALHLEPAIRAKMLWHAVNGIDP